MNAAPLAPAPDVDQALLVRQAMDMDWPPAPAVDAFVEHAIERMSEDLDGIEPSAPPPRIELPPQPVTVKQAGSGKLRKKANPHYEPRPGSYVAAIIDLLRKRGPLSGSEIMDAIGRRGRERQGLTPFLREPIAHGLVRRIPDPNHGSRRLYEALR